jgi:hypothetical protein
MKLVALSSSETSVAMVVAIAVVGIALSAMEELYRRDVFAKSGLLDWSVLRNARGVVPTETRWRLLELMFSPNGFHAVLMIKFCVTMMLEFLVLAEIYLGGVEGGIHPLVFAALSGVLLFTLMIFKVRTSYGMDGSDHMNIVIFIAVTLFFLSPAESFARTACVLYIGLQSVLSYVVSGIAKTTGSEWRAGTAMVGIFNTHIYGHALAGRILRGRPVLGRVMCWGIIAFQLAFVLVLVVDERWMLVILFVGATFHIATALLMGLNSFVFSFIATYPAVIFLHYWVRTLL